MNSFENITNGDIKKYYDKSLKGHKIFNILTDAIKKMKLELIGLENDKKSFDKKLLEQNIIKESVCNDIKQIESCGLSVESTNCLKRSKMCEIELKIDSLPQIPPDIDRIDFLKKEINSLETDLDKIESEYNKNYLFIKEYLLWHFKKFYYKENGSLVHKIEDYLLCDHNNYEDCQCYRDRFNTQITFNDILQMIDDNKFRITYRTKLYTNAIAFYLSLEYYDKYEYKRVKSMSITYIVMLYFDSPEKKPVSFNKNF